MQREEMKDVSLLALKNIKQENEQESILSSNDVENVNPTTYDEKPTNVKDTTACTIDIEIKTEAECTSQVAEVIQEIAGDIDSSSHLGNEPNPNFVTSEDRMQQSNKAVINCNKRRDKSMEENTSNITGMEHYASRSTEIDKGTDVHSFTGLITGTNEKNSGSSTPCLSGHDCAATSNIEFSSVKQEPADDTVSQSLENGMVFSMVEIGDSVNEKRDCQDSTSDEDSDSETTDSDSSSSSDETSSDETCDLTIRNRDIELSEEIAALKNLDPPKVKGEILSNELPPVEDLNIHLPDDAVLEPIGKVAHIMEDYSVVIQSYGNKPALDLETVLFLSRQMAIGKVDETFGPVPSPYYVIRFNNQEHLELKCIELSKEVFYAPHIKDFTSFVFVSELRKIRGSDASWCNDREPPPSCVDYSDDEQEREARRKRKNEASENGNETAGKNVEGRKGLPESRRGGGTRRGRGRGRGDHWHNESRRFNVTGRSAPDSVQAGWQAAVDGMSRPGQGLMRPSRMPPPPDLRTCFARPPSEIPGYHCYRGPHQSYTPEQHEIHFSGQFPPPVRWNRPPPPPQFHPATYGFGFPPPPPPP